MTGKIGLRAAAAFGGIGFASLLSALSLTRGPYLGRPDDTSVAVVWLTDAASSSRVDYQLSGGEVLTFSDPTPVTRHVVRLTGLDSGADYLYSIYSDGVQLSSGSRFRAPRGAEEAAFRFAVIGDTAGVVVPSELARAVPAENVDFVLHTGDVVYPRGAETDYEQQFFAPLAPLLANLAVLPTLGNHDVMTANGGPYLTNFVLPKNDVDGGSRFYAFRHGSALFVSVDVESSQFGDDSVQYEWLARTLSQSDALWKIVFLHEPPYSSAQSNLAVRFVLTPLFESAGVDVVFAGHQHLYERTVPLRNFSDTGPTVVYITEGGGGASLFPFIPEPFSALVIDLFGYVVADVEGGVLSLTARGTDGAAFDSVTLRKTSPSPQRIRPSRISRPRRATRIVLEPP